MNMIITTKNIFKYPIDCILELLSKQIVIACCSGHISLYSINYTTKTFNIDYIKSHCHTDTILSLCELNNNRLISSSNDKLIIIWRIFPKEIQMLKVIASHSHYIYKVSLIHNSNSFLSCSWDKTIKIWHSEDYHLLQTLHEDKWIYSCIHLKYNANLIACSCSGYHMTYISFWDICSKQRITVVDSVYTNHSGGLVEVNKECIAVSEFGRVVLIDTIKGMIRKIIKNKCMKFASSICLVRNGIIYGYEGKLCVISLIKEDVVYVKEMTNEFRGYYGVLSINCDKYIIADNNYKGFSLFEINDII